MDFWTFVTTGTAPWWSALLGTIVGGIITYLTTHRLSEKQRIADGIKADDVRIQAEKDKWRDETIALISELLVASYRYQDVTLRARRDLRAAHPQAPEPGTEERRAYGRKIDELGDDVLSSLTEIRRITAMLQVISIGDIAVAAVRLMSALTEHAFELEEFDFQKSQLEAAGASGRLIQLAAEEFGYSFGSRNDSLFSSQQ